MTVTTPNDAAQIALLKGRKLELQKVVTSIQAELSAKRLYDGERMLGEHEFHRRRAEMQRRMVKLGGELRDVKHQIEIISDRQHQAKNHGKIEINLLLKEILRVRDYLREQSGDPTRTEVYRHISRETAAMIDGSIARARELEQVKGPTP